MKVPIEITIREADPKEQKKRERLLLRCVSVHYNYSQRCARVERRHRLPQYSYHRRTPFETVLAEIDEWSMEQLAEFHKKTKEDIWRLQEQEFHDEPRVIYCNPYEIGEEVRDWWISIKERIGRRFQKLADKLRGKRSS